MISARVTLTIKESKFARNYAETVLFRNISTPGNQVKYGISHIESGTTLLQSDAGIAKCNNYYNEVQYNFVTLARMFSALVFWLRHMFSDWAIYVWE